MTEINETPLPGLGVRHDFGCASGDVVGVVSHRSGRRQLLIYDKDDTDAVALTVSLSPDESRVLAELLGGSTITERLEDLRQEISGLALEWLPISANSPYAGHRLGDTELRTRTGSSIVALVRDDNAIPAPGPDDLLLPGDTAVVVGTAEGLAEAEGLLGGSAT